MLASIRCYFAERSVLEVETPLLASAVGTDPQLDYFSTHSSEKMQARSLYLQSSPEFAMKRLLASGCGSIFQICKAFRNGEAGRYHNPEFTLLEWYRVGYGLADLMQDVEELFAVLLGVKWYAHTAQRFTYQEIFKRYTGLDALAFDVDAYIHFAELHQLEDARRLCGSNHALWLDFLFSHCVQPKFKNFGLTQVYAYPACQAALARINVHDERVADRVEVFWHDVELGNGFHELDDACEQEIRFDRELQYRLSSGLPLVAKDYKFLAALKAGLPNCSGIAIGLDRLLMILSGVDCIDNVLAFPFARV